MSTSATTLLTSSERSAISVGRWAWRRVTWAISCASTAASSEGVVGERQQAAGDVVRPVGSTRRRSHRRIEQRHRVGLVRALVALTRRSVTSLTRRNADGALYSPPTRPRAWRGRRRWPAGRARWCAAPQGHDGRHRGQRAGLCPTCRRRLSQRQDRRRHDRRRRTMAAA